MTRDDRELLRMICFLESQFDAPTIAEICENGLFDDIKTSINVLLREGMIGRMPFTKPRRYQTTGKGRAFVMKEAA